MWPPHLDEKVRLSPTQHPHLGALIYRDFGRKPRQLFEGHLCDGSADRVCGTRKARPEHDAYVEAVTACKPPQLPRCSICKPQRVHIRLRHSRKLGSGCALVATHTLYAKGPHRFQSVARQTLLPYLTKPIHPSVMLSVVAMRKLLERALADIRHVAADLEPRTITSAEAAELIQIATRIEQGGAALKLLLAPRLRDDVSWRREGHRSAASWLAAKSGTSLGQAVGMIETAEKLQDLEKTTEALRLGDISAPEAAQVAAAAAKDPASESKLLDVAQRHSMKGLQECSRRLLATAASQETDRRRYTAIHRERYLRHWCDAKGAFRLDARLTPDDGARLLAGVEREAERFFSEARERGDHEPHHAYQADALVALTSGRAKGRRSSKGTSCDTLTIHVDASALRRGHSIPGERCEIAGVGAVPVAVANRALGNAFVKILVKDGVDIRTVCHAGRTVPAHLQTALEARDPVCVVPGCQVSQGLENHHWSTPFAECGTNTLDGLARVCSHHHDLVTYEGFVLKGGPGQWAFSPPKREMAPDGKDPTR
jgi:hypothetical protein